MPDIPYMPCILGPFYIHRWRQKSLEPNAMPFAFPNNHYPLNCSSLKGSANVP